MRSKNLTRNTPENGHSQVSWNVKMTLNRTAVLNVAVLPKITEISKDIGNPNYYWNYNRNYEYNWNSKDRSQANTGILKKI